MSEGVHGKGDSCCFRAEHTYESKYRPFYTKHLKKDSSFMEIPSSLSRSK